jgi:hypothetical protein
MSDRERYEHLTRHFDSLKYTDEYKISRVNYRFLLTSHNKYLKAKDENAKLKLQIKMLEMGVRV